MTPEEREQMRQAVLDAPAIAAQADQDEQLRRSGVAFSWTEARRSRAEELEALYAIEQAQESRHNAVALAVDALKPLAGAYRNAEEYGADIISVAEQLGDWIRDGSQPA